MDTSITTFIIMSVALTVAPGADTFLVIRNVIRGGAKTGMITTIGVCSGLFVHATLSACGISVILVQSATAFHVMKTIGAAYLIWLGFCSIKDAIRGVPELHGMDEEHSGIKEKISWKQSLKEGVMSNVLNPKTAVFYMAFLPQFIHPEDSVLLKSLTLAGIHFMMAVAWLWTISLFLGRIKNWLTRPKTRAWFEGSSGAILIAFGIKLGTADAR